MKSIRVITLGCSKNTVDTEHLLSRVNGIFDIHSEEDSSQVDYLLINTCGFIGDSKEQSIQTILAAAEEKARGNIGELIVFGCLSQRYSKELPESIPEVDAWFGARELSPILRYLGVKSTSENIYDRYLTGKAYPYAYLKISEGCDRRCSYCAIPFIRGVHRSVPIDILEKEAQALADKGVRELILIAQDTTYYGLDIYHKRTLALLLERLSKIKGIRWLRIHYSYPADFPEDVLEQMAVNPKVCRYIDIPLQHVSDKILDMMHRHVSGAWTRELIDKIRSKVPGIALRTTMIVGHPGEGEEEFEELLEFINTAKFERLGAFRYSEEEGTFDAKHFKDDVSPEIKDIRYERLMSAQSEISLNYNRSRLESVVEVLVDDCVDGKLICRSEFESPEVDGEIIVDFDAKAMGTSDPEKLIGQFIKVEITGVDEYDLSGKFLGYCEE